MCIIDKGASKRRTQNTHFRARRADHSTTSMCQNCTVAPSFFVTAVNCDIS